MSNREKAEHLLKELPEYKIAFVIAYMQGLNAIDDIPNAETAAAMKELDEGRGTQFNGSTKELFADLMKD